MDGVPTDMFRFTQGDRAELYTAILHAFSEAGERMETALGLDDVRDRLRSVGWFGAIEDDDLARALEQLRNWKLLDVVQNQAENYRTASEYERRNLRYSLSRQGAAAFAGVRHALGALSSSGALQTAVLDAIAVRLEGLAVALDDSSDRRVFTTLMELEGHLEALRDNAKRFNGELQRLLRAEGADLATFHEVKGATITYLEEFLTNLDQRTHMIAARVGRIDAERLHRRALAGADLPPTAGEAARADWLEHRRTHWESLLAWFKPADGGPARVEQLHTVARRAIVTLLQVLDRISESRRRASSAAADFRELARWFAAAPAEADLHRLWSTAFGMGSARHAHLGHLDPELVPANTAWADAPPVEVSALLRSSGRTERFTRAGKVRDVSAIKAARAERARAERAELQEAWRRLATDGEVRLSAFGELDHVLFQRLLDMLGRALSASPDSTGVRRGATSDGKVELILRQPPDSRGAVLTTPRGRFAGPDFLVDIRVTGGRS
ncbi:TIGR02677 family protein [Amycolatopsis xylanica]|nr:TIGR02677 family protein [Amycolatopsis xylanica]